MSLVFKKILVPIDFGETSATALHYAKELVRQNRGELHLLHVLEDPMLLTGWPILDGNVAPDVLNAEPLRAQLEQLLTASERSELKATAHVTIGDPTGAAICRYAMAGEIELIVMGTHGRGAVAHAVMGSVAEKVVRWAPCPVLTIRHPSHRANAVKHLQLTSEPA